LEKDEHILESSQSSCAPGARELFSSPPLHHLECEEIFFNEPIVAKVEKRGTSQEERVSALGLTNEGRFLFVVFTIRRGRIRVISARDMNNKERKIYHEKIKKDTEI